VRLPVTLKRETQVVSVEVVFETHSLTVDNERGVATGWLPGRLSADGQRLAEELGERRREDGISVVFTSDLRRAVETAEIAFAGTAIRIYRDARLRECNYGAMNGMPAAKLKAERPVRIDRPFPGGESWRQAVDRVGGFLQELAQTQDGERVLVIGHVATRWALDHFVNGTPLAELVHAPFDWREGWIYTLHDVRVRDVVRCVLVDHERGVLLVEVDDVDGDAAWALPGGGVEPNEDHVLALVRELGEELGIDKAAIGRFLWSREYPFPIGGEAALWREQVYLMASDGLIVASANTRWWSAAELRTSAERFLPHELPLRLVELLEDGEGR